MIQNRRYFILFAVLLLALAACNKSEQAAEGDQNTSKTASKETSKPAEPTIPDGQPFAQGGDFSASHILISFTGASRANPNVTRSKEEAKVKAEQLNARLLEDPELFDELAKAESDGPSAPRAGNLGVFRKGAMVPEFEAALNTLLVGGITQAPIKTPFGYHIIRRNGLEKKHWAADAFIVAWKSPRTPPEVTRTKEEATVIADEIKAKLNKGNFDELAKTYNDLSPDKSGAVFLGAFTEDQNLSPEILASLKTLAYGDVAGYFDMPFGFTFIRRVKVERRAGSHILISYQGAKNANANITRTKEEAKARAQELINELKDKTDSFAEYARQNSDGPSGPRGGSLGTWFKGQMVPAFEEGIAKLKDGDITLEAIETPFGFHIIRREAPQN